MSDERYPPWPDMFRWLNVLKDRVETLPSISAEQVVTGEFDPSLIPPIPWDGVLKAGSSLGDLETRSASDLSSGTLPAARMPALTGDATTVAGTVATTLATVNTTPGTYGTGMRIPLITVNGKGLVTSILEQPIAGSPFTPGSVIFAGTLGQFAQDNAHLFWDDTNNRLGIGTPAPANILDIVTTFNGALVARVKNLSTAAGNTHASIIVENSTSYGQLFKAGTGYSGYKNIQAGDLGFFNITAGNMSTLNDAGNINFSAQGAAVPHFTLLGFGAGFGMTAPSAWIHLGAGTATASTAPLKFTSGSLLTTAEAGAVEFLTDAWYGTITTGAARKQFLLNEGTAFTTGSVPFATTNGRLTQDNANFFYDVTNHRLGIGNTSPQATLHVTGSAIEVENQATGFARVQVFSKTGTDAYMWFLNQGTNEWSIGLDASASGNLVFAASSALGSTDRFSMTQGGLAGIGVAPSAVLTLKAGTATANTAPLKLTSGTNLTTAEAGAIEFTTDDFFATITTGAARKAFILDDGARLTSGKIPIATTNGRLINLTASAAYTPTNVTTDRSYDANATTLDEIADVVGTMIADLQAKGILG